MTDNESFEFEADNYGRVKKANSVIMHRALGVMQATDEKLFNYLLNRGYNRLHSRDPIHRIPMADAVEFLKVPVSAINESLRRLGEVHIEIDYEDTASGEKRMMVLHFLSFDSTTSSNGILEWAFDPMLNELLREPRIYAILNLKTIRKFKTLAGERLYEKMMVQNAMTLNKTWRVSVGDFYKFCNQFNDEARFTNFRNRVIIPAVEEVNEYAPFSVEVSYIRDPGRGRKVQWIEFTPVPKSAQDLLAPPKSAVRKVARDKRSIDLFDNRTDEERGSSLVVSEQAYEAAQGMLEGTDLDLAKISGEFIDFAQTRVIRDIDQQFLNFVQTRIDKAQIPEFAAVSDDIIGEYLK
jgi:Initiator Replication protein